MAYNKGKYPFEAASKIAHMDVIRDVALAGILESLRSDAPGRLPTGCARTGSVDLSLPHGISTVVTVDGGLTVIPNPARYEKRVAFVQIGTMMLSLSDLDLIRREPFMDPRDLKVYLDRVDRYAVVVPLSGVRLPGRSVRDSNREILNAILSPPWTGLYDVLEFFLWRGWLGHTAPPPKHSFACVSCGKPFDLPKARSFSCPHCSFDHYLSDYLGLTSETEDYGREQMASMVMATIELLALLRLPVELARRGELARLSDFLLIKDGALMLRAQGYRVIDRVREFIEWIHATGHQIYLVGVEKTGDFAEFVQDFQDILPDPGDHFLPSRRFVVEDIQGMGFDPATHWNRVSYGTRIGARLSSTHVVALQIPTVSLANGGPLHPEPADLVGLADILRALGGLTSSSHDNALLPLVLANRAVSLSNKPSSGILNSYLMSFLADGA